jgi:hypothetical protein
MAAVWHESANAGVSFKVLAATVGRAGGYSCHGNRIA